MRFGEYNSLRVLKLQRHVVLVADASQDLLLSVEIAAAMVEISNPIYS